MEKSRPGRTTLIAHTASAGGTACLFLIASCIILLKQKYGAVFFGVSLVLSIALVALVIRRSQWLGALLSLVTGILSGILLALVYGWTYSHHHLSTPGWIALAALPLLAAGGFFLMNRAAARIASRYPEIEKPDALRIVMIGSLGTAAVAAATVVILAIAVHAV